MVNRVQELASSMEGIMPEVRDQILENSNLTNWIGEELRTLVNPIIQADLIKKTDVLNDKT